MDNESDAADMAAATAVPILADEVVTAPTVPMEVTAPTVPTETTATSSTTPPTESQTMMAAMMKMMEQQKKLMMQMMATSASAPTTATPISTSMAAASSSSTVSRAIDTRGMLKCENYNGEKEKLQPWKRVLYSMFGSVEPDWLVRLKAIEENLEDKKIVERYDERGSRSVKRNQHVPAPSL